MTQPFNFSTQADNRLPLRFAGLLHGQIKADVCASTGIMSGKDVAKMILAGASAVQVVTALYRNGVKSIRTMLDELSRWMDGNPIRRIDALPRQALGEERKGSLGVHAGAVREDAAQPQGVHRTGEGIVMAPPAA